MESKRLHRKNHVLFHQLLRHFSKLQRLYPGYPPRACSVRRLRLFGSRKSAPAAGTAHQAMIRHQFHTLFQYTHCCGRVPQGVHRDPNIIHFYEQGTQYNTGVSRARSTTGNPSKKTQIYFY